MTGRKNRALQVAPVVPYRALGKFPKTLYGKTCMIFPSCHVILNLTNPITKFLWDYFIQEMTVSQPRGVSNTISKWFENHQWQPKAFRLTATASFLSTFFQLLQYSRQRLGFSVHRGTEMKKTTDLTFPTFSLRFADFAVWFCFCCKFPFHKKWLI